jgi:hypothetical protein
MMQVINSSPVFAKEVRVCVGGHEGAAAAGHSTNRQQRTPRQALRTALCSKVLPTAPCRTATQVQVSLKDVKEVRTAPRALGLWGDCVIFLKVRRGCSA